MIRLPPATLRTAADLRTAEKGRSAASRLGDRLGSRLLRNTRAPVDVHALASSEDIEVIPASALTESGRIEWTRDGLRIALSGRESPQRQRFTLAHELGHHLIFGIDKKGARTYSREEERRCDRFAAALLMPGKVFADAFKGWHGRSRASAVRALADQFGVSLRAAMIRLNDLALMDADSILLMCEADAHGGYRVYAGAYNRTAYRRLEHLTTQELGINDALVQTKSMPLRSRSRTATARLPKKLRGLPPESRSYLPATVTCIPVRGDQEKLLVEIELVINSLPPRILKQPLELQADLLKRR